MNDEKIKAVEKERERLRGEGERARRGVIDEDKFKSTSF